MAPDRSLFLSPLDPPPEQRPGAATGPPAGHPEGTLAGDAAIVASPGDAVPVGGRRRRRLGVAAAIVALLLAAVVANRARAGDDAVADGDSATPPPRSATTEADRSTATTTDPRPGRPTTTAAGSTTEATATLGPRLPSPSGTTLVVATSNRLVIAHLDTGTVRTLDLVTEVQGGQPFEAVTDVGDAFLVGGERPRLVPRAAGATVERSDLPSYSAFLPSSLEGRFWTVEPRFDLELVEWTLEGETGRRLELPGGEGRVLPFGDRFLISPAGSMMAVDPTTGRAERIGDGIAVAVDAQTLVRTRCDESLECGLVLSDLDGGDERAVGPPTPRSRYDTYAGGRFSPDGRWLVIPFFGEDQPGGLALIDVVRGERRPTDSLTTLSGGGFPPAATFSADSRWLLIADPSGSDELKAIDLADGTRVAVDLGTLASDGDGMVLSAFPSIPADAEH